MWLLRFQPPDYALELDANANVDLSSEGGPFFNANTRCHGVKPILS